MTTPSESTARVEDATARLDSATAILAETLLRDRISQAAVDGAVLLAQRAIRDLQLWSEEPHPEATCR